MNSEKKPEEERAEEKKHRHDLKIDVEKIRHAVQEVKHKLFEAIAAVVPKGVYEHAGAAKKEILLAVKSLIDDEIKRTDENMSEVEKARQKQKGKE